MMGKFQKGFTLIELLIAVAIFVGFIALGANAVLEIMRAETKADVMRKTQTQTRYILETILREARVAEGELAKNRVRKAHAFKFLNEGEVELYGTIGDDAKYLKIIDTDFEAGQPVVSKKLFYLEDGVLKMEIEEEGTFDLNDKDELIIKKFSLEGSYLPLSLEEPPFLKITLKAETPGKEKKKYFERAEIEITSGATPRSY